MQVGIILLARWRSNWALAALALTLAVNLLAPAKHVNAVFSLDIENVWRERMRENRLPDTVNPVAYNMRAIGLADAGNISGAKTYFTYALALAESYPSADAYFVPDVYWNRATLYLRAERWAAARADLVAALACAPGRLATKTFGRGIRRRHRRTQSLKSKERYGRACIRYAAC